MNEKSKRGFALMTPETRKKIASMGGKAVIAKGTGYRFSSESAKEAGKMGGLKVSQDRQHMADIGRKGGQNRKK